MIRAGFFAAAVALAALAAPGVRAAERPRYIFINTSSLRGHDTALKMSLKVAEKQSGIENALVMLERLPEKQTIEQTAAKLFDKYRVGQTRKGRGILYLYSEKENQFKIEVSYALEGIFPDGVCGRLEKAARTYMLSEIPQDFLSELLITMNLHGVEKNAVVEAAAPDWLMTAYLSGGAGVSARGVRPTLADIEKAIERVEAGDRAAYDPAMDAAETLRRYFRSLEAGIGDPQLPLLTPGSQIFRMVVPRNAAQQRRVFDYYRKAWPYKLVEEGEFALAYFQPGVANLPVVLRRTRQGAWLVDEAKAWTWFHRFEDNVNFFPKYDDIPFLAALRSEGVPTWSDPIYKRRAATPRPPILPGDLSQMVSALEAVLGTGARDAATHEKLGDLYLFEMNWRSKAIEHFEKAAALRPDHLPYRWRLFDLYVNNSEVERALAELATLVKAAPNDEEAKRWLEFYTEAYAFKPGEF